MVFQARKKNSPKKGKPTNRFEGANSVILQPSLHESSDANATISITRSGSEKGTKGSKRVASFLTRCFSSPSRSIIKENEKSFQSSGPVLLVKNPEPVLLEEVQDSLEPFKLLGSSAATEDYYSAVSTFDDIFTSVHESIENDSSSELIQIKSFDVHAPAAIPTNSVSASEQLVEYVPQESGICGKWIKSYSESTPVPGPADKVISAGFAVQRVRNKLCRFNFSETKDELTLEIIVPVMGMAPWVEKYKKDGSLCKFKNRRDYRSGSAFGQAMVLANGRIMLRVWNLGSSPEVMWEETIELSENTLKLEHHAYRLDGTKTGTQSSVLVCYSSMRE